MPPPEGKISTCVGRNIVQPGQFIVFLYFINATETDGPSSILEWEGATRLLHAVLGLPKDLKRHDVYHAYIDVNEFKENKK